MRAPARVLLALSVLVLACCESCQGKPPKDRPVPGKAIVLPPGQNHSATKVHKTTPAIVPEATIVERSGDVKVARAASTTSTPGLAEQETSLFVGDGLSTGPDGFARLDIGLESFLTLGPSSRLSIGPHRPQELVLHRGTATLDGAAIKGYTRRFEIMTPGGAVFYAGPAMAMAVTDAGELRVDVTDCPLKPPKPRSSIVKVEGEEEILKRCSMIVGDEEQFLVTGDRVLVGRDLKVDLSLIGDDAPALADWLTQSNARLAEDPSAAVSGFAAWILPAMEQVEAHLAEVVERRTQNKELIEKLRDLRKAGKPDASKNVPAVPGGPASETEAVKQALRDNSAAQYKLRLLLMARFHQVALRFELLEHLLSDQALAGSGATLAQIEKGVKDLDTEFLSLISRKPHRKVPPKPMPKHLLEKPLPLPKKPIEKHG